MGKIYSSLDDLINEVEVDEKKEAERRKAEEKRIEDEMRSAREKADEVLRDMAAKRHEAEKPLLQDNRARDLVRAVRDQDLMLRQAGISEKDRIKALREFAKEHINNRDDARELSRDPSNGRQDKANDVRRLQEKLIEKAYQQAKLRQEEINKTRKESPKNKDNRNNKKRQELPSRVHDLEKGVYTAVLVPGNENAVNRFHGNNEAKDYVMFIGSDGEPLAPPMDKQYVMDQFAMKSLIDGLDNGTLDIESSFMPDAICEYVEDAEEKIEYTARAMIYKEEEVINRETGEKGTLVYGAQSRDEEEMDYETDEQAGGIASERLFIITEDAQILTIEEFGAYEREIYESREYRGMDYDDDIGMEHEFGSGYFEPVD